MRLTPRLHDTYIARAVVTSVLMTWGVLLGLDAVPAVFGWMPNLHTPAATDPQDLASAGTATADSHQR